MTKPPRTSEVEPDNFDEILATVGLRVKEARQKFNITQRELATKTGFQQTYIYEIETGKSNITLKTLAKFADAFAMDIRDFFPAPDAAAPAPAFTTLSSILDKVAAILAGTAAVLAGNEDQAAAREAQFSALVAELKSFAALRFSLEQDAKRAQNPGATKS